jgi:predicted nucleic acid-binding protein
MALTMFDTSVYIPFYRREAYEQLIEEQERRLQVRLCSIVLQELYAGARSKKTKLRLDEINRLYARLGFLVTPDHEDWVQAGVFMARYIRLYGNIRPRDHLNDMLILLCSTKVKATLATENVKDYVRWQKMLKQSGISCSILALSRASK